MRIIEEIFTQTSPTEKKMVTEDILEALMEPERHIDDSGTHFCICAPQLQSVPMGVTAFRT